MKPSRQTDQQGSPGPAPARSHHPAHSDCATEDKQTINQEARNLDPAQIANAHQAQLVPAEVENRANQDFDHANPHVERAGDHAAGQERPCHGRIHRAFS